MKRRSEKRLPGEDRERWLSDIRAERCSGAPLPPQPQKWTMISMPPKANKARWSRLFCSCRCQKPNSSETSTGYLSVSYIPPPAISLYTIQGKRQKFKITVNTATVTMTTASARNQLRQIHFLLLGWVSRCRCLPARDSRRYDDVFWKELMGAARGEKKSKEQNLKALGF